MDKKVRVGIEGSLLLLIVGLWSQLLIGQSSPAKKDIPSIAKSANGSVVSIVMSDKGGKPLALGSGFLVSNDGLVVTNYHVIAEGSSAVIKFPDGSMVPVDGVLAADKTRDLAVIKTHGKVFRTLTLGNSDQLQVGEEVVAIGNPLSLESTVSNGIVSGIRTAEKLGGKFLQTTAPISPGSSGGPLFNMFGEVIGINTMYLEGGENLNFAIPINDAKRLLRSQYTTLQNLPNEPESTDTESAHSTTGGGQIAQINSSAYQAYQELLKTGDEIVKTGTYACFDDDQKSNTFFVISANFLGKTMVAMVTGFTKGVKGEEPLLFQGPVGLVLPGKQGFFATLPTAYNVNVYSTHLTDTFEWSPDLLTMKTGFGKPLPGEVPFTYKFNMQRSTGRYTEQSVLGSGSQPDGSTLDDTGRCIRIPNTLTPEEKYRMVN